MVSVTNAAVWCACFITGTIEWCFCFYPASLNTTLDVEYNCDSHRLILHHAKRSSMHKHTSWKQVNSRIRMYRYKCVYLTVRRGMGTTCWFFAYTAAGALSFTARLAQRALCAHFRSSGQFGRCNRLSRDKPACS